MPNEMTKSDAARIQSSQVPVTLQLSFTSRLIL